MFAARLSGSAVAAAMSTSEWSQVIHVVLNSVAAVAKVVIMAAVGAILVKVGVINAEVRGGVGKMVFMVFAPCLVFAEVGMSLSIERLLDFAIVACFCCLFMASNFIAGLLVLGIMEVASRLLGGKPQELHVDVEMVEASEMAAEEAEVELAVDDGEEEAKKQPSQDGECEPDEEDDMEDVSVSPAGEGDVTLEVESDADESVPARQHSFNWGHPVRLLVACSFANSGSMPLALVGSLYKDDAELQRAVSYISVFMSAAFVLLYTVGYLVLIKAAEFDQASKGGAKAKGLWEFAKELVKKLVSPPIIALLASCCISLIPFLRPLLFPPINPDEDSSTPPLSFLLEAIMILANCTVGCTTIVLGANLSKGPMSSALSARDIVAVGFTKLMFSPFCGLIITEIARNLGIITDPVMHMVLLIETATPPAMSLVILAGIIGSGEAETSSVLFCVYLMSTVTFTGWLCIFTFVV